MNVNRNRRHAMLSWMFVCVLVALCAILGVLQYRWIGEVSVAERDRLKAGLQASLARLSRDFSNEVTSAAVGLMPEPGVEGGPEAAKEYAARYRHWKESGGQTGLFRRVAVATPHKGDLELQEIDRETGDLRTLNWPAEWNPVREFLQSRLSDEGGPGPGRRQLFGPPQGADRGFVFELPRFRPPWTDGPRMVRGAADWMVVELDPEFLKTTVFPELIQRHLTGGGALEYQAEIVAKDASKEVIYRTADTEPIGDKADAAVGVFELQFERIFRRMAPGNSKGEPFRAKKGPGQPPPSPDRGRWLMSVRHKAGSIDAVVSQARTRNLGVSAGILALILAAVAALVQFTRRAQRLAELEMEFVAGVSHELRTPLSVIRTAAHNLRGGLVSNAKQVERYGALIGDEAERLTTIVEQVLRFASSKAGATIQAREMVSVADLVEGAVQATSRAVSESGCKVELRIEPDLPAVLADPIALQHALQNLLTNAAKYGASGGWIGITAVRPEEGPNDPVEIRVADRGQGIPADELGHIFDPFYRGKKAQEDQIHGTGLGLSLVQRIVEAHGGKVVVYSEPGKGTEFVMRVPVGAADRAPLRQTDELPNPAG